MAARSTAGPTSLSSPRLEEAAELGRALISGGSPGAGLLMVDPDMRVVLAHGCAHPDLDNVAIVGRLISDVVPAAAWAVLKPRYQAALHGRAQAFCHGAESGAPTRALRLAPVVEESAVIGAMVISEPRPSDGEGLQRSLLDLLEEGVIVVDPQGRLLQANAAACSILGLDLATAGADRTWWEPFAARGATALGTGESVGAAPLKAVRADGTRLTLSVNYEPLRDDAGAVSGLMLSFADVSEREVERRQLVETEERLRETHEVAHLSSWEWQPDTDEVQIFHALAGETAAPGSRAALDELLEATPPEERQATKDDFASIVRGESDGSVRRTRRMYPAGPAWLETRTRAIRDAEGALLCVRGTSQDVTDQELAEQATTRARDFFQSTLDSLPTEIAVLDGEGAIVMTNRAWVDFGASNGATTAGRGQNYLSACDAAGDDDLAMEAAAGVRAVMSRSETGFSLEYPCHGPTVERWFVLHAARFDGPGDARVVVSHTDMTKRHQAEVQVATQAALLDEVDVAVVATDRSGKVTHWNRGAERQLGWTYAETVGRDAVDLVSPPGADENREFDVELRRDGRREGELTVSRRNGSTFRAFVHGRLMSDAAGLAGGTITVLVDVSERVIAERALLAAHNHMAAIADSMGEGLFALDPEGRLIYMNDAGAQMLGWTLEELQGRVMHDVTHSRRPDGSAFPIEDCPMLHARRDRMRLRIEDDVFMRRDGHRLPVAYTASPFETEDGLEGCVVVFEDITERKEREAALQVEADKLGWISRIQDALAEDRFLLHAQPIVDLQSGEVVQHELLLRMREPSGEVVGPAAYLEVAEQYGLIGEIDRWVIGRGIEIAAGGEPVQINVSGHSIGDQGVLDQIEQCLLESGADPAHIVFEITETAIADDAAAASAFVERLHALGCRVALDDFGTGYGGFTYLKQLPVDALKIDIEFVRDLTTTPASRHVVQAVVALARGFGLETVAEGIEDEETLVLLRELGVTLGQGYHVGRPAALDSIERATTGGITRGQ